MSRSTPFIAAAFLVVLTVAFTALQVLAAPGSPSDALSPRSDTEELARIESAYQVLVRTEVEAVFAHELAAALRSGRLHGMDSRLAISTFRSFVSRTGEALDAASPHRELRQSWQVARLLHREIAGLEQSLSLHQKPGTIPTTLKADAERLLSEVETVLAGMGADPDALRKERQKVLSDLSAQLSLSAGMSLIDENPG